MAAAQKKTIRLAVHGNVTLPDLNTALARAVKLTGCLACGLVGVDLDILGGDPAVEGEFKGVTGIATASFG